MSGNRRSQRPYPPEFKLEEDDLYRRSSKSIVWIAAEIGVAPEPLRK